MPIASGCLEMVRGNYYDTLTCAKGETFSCFTMFRVPSSHEKPITHTNMVLSQSLPVYLRFVVRRLRMEIVEGCAEDVACIRQCFVQLSVGWKPHWRGPASTLLLEDWLRKAIRNIKKGRDRRIEKYLDRAWMMSLGGLEPTVIEGGEHIEVRLSSSAPFTLASNLAVRFFIEGTEYRPVQ